MFIKCDKCSNKIQVPDNFSGTTGKCPSCKESITIKKQDTGKKEIICHLCYKNIIVPIKNLSDEFIKGKCPYCQNQVSFNKDSSVTKMVEQKTYKEKDPDIEYNNLPFYQRYCTYVYLYVFTFFFCSFVPSLIGISLFFIPIIGVFCNIYTKDKKTGITRRLNLFERLWPLVFFIIFFGLIFLYVYITVTDMSGSY